MCICHIQHVIEKSCVSTCIAKQVSVAELVYGKPLRIPGQLLAPTGNPVDPVHHITELHQHIACLKPVPAACHSSPATFIHSDLEKWTHVFLLQDTMHWGLEPPNKSCHGERRHCISSCGRSAMMSADRFKPADILNGIDYSFNPPDDATRAIAHLPCHRSPLHELHAPVATSIFLLPTSEQPSPRRGAPTVQRVLSNQHSPWQLPISTHHGNSNAHWSTHLLVTTGDKSIKMQTPPALLVISHRSHQTSR
jgi:hypothetical protein